MIWTHNRAGLLRTSGWSNFITGTAALLAFVGGAGECHAQSLADRIKPLIAAHEGKVSVAIKHLATGDSFVHEADTPMPTASLIKLPIMVEAYRQAAAGTVNLDEPLTLKAEDKVPGSGILTTHFSPGAALCLRDAVRLMIAYSDNTATNLVLAKIGLGATAQTMDQLGLPNTKVHSFVFRQGTSIFPERSKQFGLGSTTAAEMIRLLEDLVAKKLVTPAACDEMLAHLRTCEDNRIPKLLPVGVKVAHKTGSVSAIRTAAGIIEAKSGPIALCVLTRDNKDQRWTGDNAAEVLTSKIALAAFEHFEGPAADRSRDNPASRALAGVADDDAPADGVLRIGASGELVQAVQRTLNARLNPSPDLSVDGDFGPATKAAVQAFQRAKGLAVSGEVGPETFAALGALVEEEPVPDPAAANAATLPRQPRDSLDGPPLVTCKAWAIGDLKTGALLATSRESEKLDIASTTKVMTAYLVCRLAQDDPRVLDEVVTFSAAADKTIGSTAGLRAGEKIRVGELLYGLMLPSGNDAATALAEHFGPRLAQASAGGNQDSAGPAAEPVAQFVAAMNRQAAALGLGETRYENPHGLTAKEHKSSARDQWKLAQAALGLPLFRKLIGTRQHGAKVTGPAGYERNVLWKNTNRLLAIDGYTGVKTGTTDAAGACLVACGERDGREVVVVILGSTSSDARYTDARNLFRWAWSQ
jgi:D-alanyl-D-alanine carboxypeptidase (penicillin-binding protein 5/6)